MNIYIITGICGTGKTFFCKNKATLFYDEVFSYKTKLLDYEKIQTFFQTNKSEKEIFLDAFNIDLIKYIKENFNINTIICKLLYTDIDRVYETIAIHEPRDFQQTLYDGYEKSIKNTITSIHNSCQELLSTNLIKQIVYVYRDIENNYQEFSDESHLFNILSESKKDRLLKFINDTSGHATYQSIILDKEYIKEGSEKDWITFDNILKCTTLKDKVIMDTGCFNGYFSFKALENGAKKVMGVDQNKPALSVCEKICVYNNFHTWENGKKTNNSCELGIHFYYNKIGVDDIFDNERTTPEIDIIFAFNYLHHLKNAYGEDAFLNTLDSFFKNSKEVIFEINENEINDITLIADKNNFILKKKIESHRKTAFGNRWILYFAL